MRLVEDFDGGAGARGGELGVVPDEEAVDEHFFDAGGKSGGVGVGGAVDDGLGDEETEVGEGVFPQLSTLTFRQDDN